MVVNPINAVVIYDKKLTPKILESLDFTGFFDSSEGET